MEYRGVFCFFLAVSSFFFCTESLAGTFKGEKISYSISPSGKAEYEDMGLVDYGGRKCWFVTLRTKVAGFSDFEKIYADPETGLPLIVEREVRWPLSKERLIEEYNLQQNCLVIKKFINDKFTDEYRYKSDSPYHNAVLLPFCLRQIDNLDIGWSMVVRLRKVFTVTLVGIEDVKVNGDTITAYHFTSTPGKFEIWISKDRNRLPIIIKGVAGCSMSIKSHSFD